MWYQTRAAGSSEWGFITFPTQLMCLWYNPSNSQWKTILFDIPDYLTGTKQILQNNNVLYLISPSTAWHRCADWYVEHVVMGNTSWDIHFNLVVLLSGILAKIVNFHAAKECTHARLWRQLHHKQHLDIDIAEGNIQHFIGITHSSHCHWGFLWLR